MRAKTLLTIVLGFVFVFQPLNAQTWEASKRLTWNSGYSEYPAIAVDAINHLHVVWHDETPGNREIYYKKSTNGGATWVNSKRLTWNLGGTFAPAIAVGSGNTIHVVWSDKTPGNSEIYYKKSTNGGVTWGVTRRVTWTAGNSASPEIAVDSGGTIHIVWSDWTPGNTEIYYKRSTDGGVTWGGFKRLPWSSGNSSHPAISTDSSNNIHVVWADNTPGHYVMYYKRSTDGGVTWSGVKRLTWGFAAAALPDIAIDSSNTIHLVWSGGFEIYYKKSTNGGLTWDSAKRLTWNSGLSSNSALAVDSGNTIHVVWGDWTSGNAEIYYKKSTNGGLTWDSAKRLTWNFGDSKFPTVATDSNDSIHVVWQNDTSSKSEIYYRKGIQ